MGRALSIALLLIVVVTAVSGQQTIYWKKDHVYAGGAEIAIITPPTTDTTAPTAPTIQSSPTNYTSVTLTWSVDRFGWLRPGGLQDIP